MKIYRTLKADGYHIFTLPVVPSSARQLLVECATISWSRHPTALGREDVFVYTDFGMDVLEKLNDIGLKAEVFYP
jgi:hypothetical protein